MNSIVNFIIKLRAQVNNLPQVTKQTERQLDRVRVGAERAGKAIHNALSVRSFGSSLMSIPGMQFLTNPYTMIAAGVGAISKLGAEAEMTAKSFEVLVGSQEQSAALLESITKYANATPYSKLDLLENAKMMMASEVEADKVEGYLKRLGDIAMGDKNKLQSLALAFGQVKSAGFINGGDLRQFLNVGFNPLKELQEMTGKSYSELQDLMSQGRITFDNIAQAIAHATDKGGKFYNMSEILSHTTQGQLSNLLGDIEERVVGLFQRIKPMVDGMIDFGVKAIPIVFSAINKAITAIEGVISWVREWWMELALVGAIIGVVTVAISAKTVVLTAYLGVMRVVTIVTKAWQATQWLLNVALNANPIGAVITAVVALVAVIVYCWNKFAGFRAFLLTMWDTFKGFGGIIKDYVINRINELLGAIGSVGRAIKLLFEGDFGGAADAVGVAVDKFAGRESAKQAISSSKGLVTGFGSHYNAILQREQAKDVKSPLSPLAPITAPSLKGSAGTSVSQESVIFGGGSGGSKGGGRTGNAIATGGQRNTTINMSIGKLIETINVRMSGKEDSSELDEAVLRSVNRALAMATSTE